MRLLVERVLMYLPDAEKCLQILKSILKPEGILCFQESDAINAGVGADVLSLHQSAIQWIWETVEARRWQYSYWSKFI